MFLEQREVAFLSPSKVCENLNFSIGIQILLGDKNATYLCSKIISTLISSTWKRHCQILQYKTKNRKSTSFEKKVVRKLVCNIKYELHQRGNKILQLQRLKSSYSIFSKNLPHRMHKFLLHRYQSWMHHQETLHHKSIDPKDLTQQIVKCQVYHLQPWR